MLAGWPCGAGRMPVRKPNLKPPFNVVRASHVAFGVRDLNRARALYVDCLGLLENRLSVICP